MKCDLIMAIWNERELTVQALESIRRNTAMPYRLILVDNASDAETREFLDDAARSGRYGETLLLRNDTNLGWLKATNQGMRASDADYLCLINNDIIAAPGWLDNIVATMERNTDIGIVNPRGNERSENERVADVDAYAHELNSKYKGRFTELDHCSGFCMVIRGHVYRKIGLLDEIFEGGHFEDDDYSRRAQQAGYLCAQCDDSFVLHLGSRTFRRIPQERQRLIDRNRQICEARWGKRQRYLVWPRGGDCTEILGLARQGHTVYVIANKHCGPGRLLHPHSNVRFLTAWIGRLFPAAYFVWQRAYLKHKRRIDVVLNDIHRNARAER